MITNSYLTRNYEVHFKYLLFFVENNVFILFATEKPRRQPIGNVKEEFGITVPLWVEKCSKVIKNVIEQVVHNNASLYRTG
jgi:ribosomal protein L22